MTGIFRYYFEFCIYKIWMGTYSVVEFYFSEIWVVASRAFAAVWTSVTENEYITDSGT